MDFSVENTSFEIHTHVQHMFTMISTSQLKSNQYQIKSIPDRHFIILPFPITTIFFFPSSVMVSELEDLALRRMEAGWNAKAGANMLHKASDVAVEYLILIF